MTDLINAYHTTAPVRLFAMAATILAHGAALPGSKPTITGADTSRTGRSTGRRRITCHRRPRGHRARRKRRRSYIHGCHNGLTENTHDFTDPDSIPGCASKPYSTPAFADRSCDHRADRASRSTRRLIVRPIIAASRQTRQRPFPTW